KNTYVAADGVNHEGFPTFHRSLEEAYLQVLLTNTLGGTFYASSNELFKGSLELHAQMAAENPAFMARALVYARNEGLMRLQPIIGLAYLAKANRELFHRIFNRVILTPGDLSDFVEIVRGDVTPGGMGRSIKRAVNTWLNSMSEYHAIKYGSGGQGYSLRDILRVSHPKAINSTQDTIFTWLTDREKWMESGKQGLTPQINAFERIKRLNLNAADAQALARSIIEEGRLPYEVVTGVIKPDVATWMALMRQMPYFALLRHLNTLQGAGVFKDGENAYYAAERLIHEKAIHGSKILPFRLFMANRMFTPQTAVESLISDALLQAMDTAFANLPDLPGDICIAPDVSSSMSGQTEARSKTQFIDIAGIFAGALVKKTQKALVMPFHTGVRDVQLSRHDSVMSNAQKIRQLMGGGTAISAPISEMAARKTKVDVFIGITDNEEWAVDHHGEFGFLNTWREYKRRFAPEAKAFLLTIAPYRHAVAPKDEPDVHYIYGWSDSVLKYISLTLSGMENQVEYVNNMEI
ncbi:MAG TPA: TROVE domain-containing protein, partial [Aggregatilineales bacterium]|nr:TROVE domain-containing protein [Aggregatilineales bacterium]